MSQIRVSSIKDLSDSTGFLLSTGKIHAIGTLTVSNIVINGKISGNSDISLVTAVHPINGGSAPDSPPITMFCGVDHFKYIV